MLDKSKATPQSKTFGEHEEKANNRKKNKIIILFGRSKYTRTRNRLGTERARKTIGSLRFDDAFGGRLSCRARERTSAARDLRSSSGRRSSRTDSVITLSRAVGAKRPRGSRRRRFHTRDGYEDARRSWDVAHDPFRETLRVDALGRVPAHVTIAGGRLTTTLACFPRRKSCSRSIAFSTFWICFFFFSYIFENDIEKRTINHIDPFVRL